MGSFSSLQDSTGLLNFVVLISGLKKKKTRLGMLKNEKICSKENERLKCGKKYNMNANSVDTFYRSVQLSLSLRSSSSFDSLRLLTRPISLPFPLWKPFIVLSGTQDLSYAKFTGPPLL